MAKAAGFTCDRPSCNTFAVADTSEHAKAVPEGWHIVFLGGDSRQEHRKEVCSDFCLAMLGVERFEREGATFRRTGAKAPEDRKTYRRYTPAEKQEIIRLVREEGKSYAEIAEAFDMPVTSVSTILTRSKNNA